MTYNLYLIENGVKTLITSLKNKRKALALISILDCDEVILKCEKLWR